MSEHNMENLGNARFGAYRPVETALLPDVTMEMLSPAFWVAEDHSTIDQSEHRSTLQQYIREHSNSMNVLLDLWRRWSGASAANDTNATLQQSDRAQQVPVPRPVLPTTEDTLYSADGHEFTCAFWDSLKAKIQSAHPVADDRPEATAALPVQPGFSVSRASLRRFPVAAPGFRTPTDREFDRFQDTALHTFEPVLIVLQTTDNKWYYVVSETYSGWVLAEHIARTSAEEFVKWSGITNGAGANRFLIPLANSIYTQVAPYDEAVSEKRLEFGAYLPLCEDQQGLGNQNIAGNAAIDFPVRNRDGWLEVRRALVAVFAPLSVGFRPYTREAVVKSTFALLGERYGWGDSFGNHDCSSLIMDSYRTIGIQLPRDAHTQEEALPNRLRIPEEATFEERTELLKSLSPGDPLYMPGHTMMYLGYRGGHHYMIHDFAGYAEPDNEGVRSVPVNEVMVSTLDIRLTSGKTYLEALTSRASLFPR